MVRVTSLHAPSLDVLMRFLQSTNTSWLHLQQYQPSAAGVQTQLRPELSESEMNSVNTHFSIACSSLCCPSLIQWLRPFSTSVLHDRSSARDRWEKEHITDTRIWKSLPSLIPHWPGCCNRACWESYQGFCGRTSLLESVCSLTHSTQRPQ